MKNPSYHILKLLGELYPPWVAYLNRNPEQKKLIVTGYRRGIPDDLPDDIASKLSEWLLSNSNKAHQKWPPTVIELRTIINMLVKSQQKPADTCATEYAPVTDPELSIHRLTCVGLMNKSLKNLFTERNAHLRPYVEKMVDCARNHPRLYRAAIIFGDFWTTFKQKYTYLNNQGLLEKLISLEHRDFIMTQIGEDINFDLLLLFLWESRWHVEIYMELDKKYKE